MSLHSPSSHFVNYPSICSILRVLCKDIRVNEDFDYEQMSRLTPGFVGADLGSLVREAAMCAVNRIFMSLEPGNQESSADKVVNSELSAGKSAREHNSIIETSGLSKYNVVFWSGSAFHSHSHFSIYC